jgi:transcriptional regulator with XRE-family HTH domain
VEAVPVGSAKALHSDRYAAFLKRLKAAREETGLSQARVASLLGRPQTWVSKCEIGERRVDFVELEDLARAYRKSLTYFATRR